MLPKHVRLTDYVVDKSFNTTQIVDKLANDYPEYDVLGSLNVRYEKGNFKFIKVDLKLNLLKLTSRRYGL